MSSRGDPTTDETPAAKEKGLILGVHRVGVGHFVFHYP